MASTETLKNDINTLLASASKVLESMEREARGDRVIGYCAGGWYFTRPALLQYARLVGLMPVSRTGDPWTDKELLDSLLDKEGIKQFSLNEALSTGTGFTHINGLYYEPLDVISLMEDGEA